MKKKFKIEELADWIKDLIYTAKNDGALSVSWFGGTKDEPFNIVGGWSEGFSEDLADVICISKQSPDYAMCVKIVVNEGPYAYTDFDMLPMPFSDDVDDTCIALEWEDDPMTTAEFFLHEWERITHEYGKIEE